MIKKNGWSEYQKLVLSELNRNERAIADLHVKLDRAIVEIATLKAKAAIWGVGAGSIPVMIYSLFKSLSN